MNEDILICPGCMNPLKIDGSFTFEDCCETSMWSNKHICDNKDCFLYEKPFWNDYGDYFSGELGFSDFEKHYGHDKYSAFNSFSKQSEIEIYKKGLRKKYYLHPILTLWWLNPYIEFIYTADKMGNILKTRYKLNFLKKEKGADGYYIHYKSSISMFIFSMKSFKRNIDYFNQKKTEYNSKSIIEDLEISSWDKRLYRHTSRWFMKKIWRKTINDAKEYKDFYDYLTLIKYKTINEKEFKKLDAFCPKELDTLDCLIQKRAKGPYMDMMIRLRKLERIIED